MNDTEGLKVRRPSDPMWSAIGGRGEQEVLCVVFQLEPIADGVMQQRPNANAVRSMETVLEVHGESSSLTPKCYSPPSADL